MRRQILSALVVGLLVLSVLTLVAASPSVLADSPRSVTVSKPVSTTTTSAAKAKTPIMLTVEYPGKAITSAAVKLTRCKVSPTAIPADGRIHTVKALPSCTIEIELPVGSHSRYSGVFAPLPSTPPAFLFVTTCPSTTIPCPLYQRLIFEQFHVDFVKKCKSSCSGNPFPTPQHWKWCEAGSGVGMNARPTSAHGFIDWTSSTKHILISSKNRSVSSALVLGSGTITANYH